MVILGGLEVVAAGYLIHRHNKNKKEKRRIEAEAAALEEQQYRIYSDPPPAADPHRRQHSHERPNRRDDKHRYDGGNGPPPYAPPQGQGGQPHAPVPAGYMNGAGYIYGQPAYQQSAWYAHQGQAQQPQGQGQTPQPQSKPGAAASYYQGDANRNTGGSQYTGAGGSANASSPHVRFAGPPPEYRP